MAINPNLHPMTDNKTLRRAISAASYAELTEALDAYHYNYSRNIQGQIEARIAYLAPRPSQTQENEPIDGMY